MVRGVQSVFDDFGDASRTRPNRSSVTHGDANGYWYRDSLAFIH